MESESDYKTADINIQVLPDSREGSIRYYARMPFIIDDMKLSLVASRLYLHLKRVIGEGGVCWQTRNTLSDICGISTGSITNAKKELVDKGLITITEKPSSRGKPHQIITLVDIWDMNCAKYDKLKEKPENPIMSPGIPNRSNNDIIMSNNDMKNNPIKNNNLSNNDKEVIVNTNHRGRSKLRPSPPEVGNGGSQVVKLFIASWGKKYPNQEQLKCLVELEKKFPIEDIQEYISWARINSMTFGHAINSAHAALSRWGKPRASPNSALPEVETPSTRLLRQLKAEREAQGGKT